jgi:hypothetical protein
MKGLAKLFQKNFNFNQNYRFDTIEINEKIYLHKKIDPNPEIINDFIVNLEIYLLIFLIY